MLQNSKNSQLLYQRSDFILELQVVDSGRRKLFRAKVNILDKKEIARIFNLLKLKFNMVIPQDLKGEISGWDKLALG